jgi:hypothetical protein
MLKRNRILKETKCRGVDSTFCCSGQSPVMVVINLRLLQVEGTKQVGSIGKVFNFYQVGVHLDTRPGLRIS